MKYKNKKVILICGYSRGGTNIVWNILQSHPDVCSTIHETGTIFRKKEPLKFYRVIQLLKKAKLLNTTLAKKIIDYQLYIYKLQSLQHADNKYKTRNQVYTRDELSKTALCLKSVDYDIYLTDLLLNIYPDIYMIFLTRNGYAVSEGHIRRGGDPEMISDLYNAIYKRMKFYLENHAKTLLIKFENVLKDPFKMSKKLLEFCECEPSDLVYLRLKSKRTMSDAEKHDSGYGTLGKKYWFDKKTIQRIIVEDVDDKQIRRLDPTTIKILNNNASEALTYFGYKLME